MLDNPFTKFPQIDLFSFLSGLVLGAVLYVVFVRLFKLISQFRSTHQKTVSKVRVNSSIKLIDRFKLNALKRAQSDHLLGSLFPLSDVYVSIPLIYPYPYVDPKSKLVDAFEASSLLPFVTDTPEFYETIPFQSKSLPSAIRDHNLLLIQGEIGSGKTTLINNSISSILENRRGSSSINGFLPVYVHCSEVDLQSNVEEQPLQILMETTQFTSLGPSKPVLLSTFLPFFTEGKVILFIDGLDEAIPSVITEFSSWTNNLIKIYPSLKIVISVNNSFTDGLLKLGFTPFLISPINTGIRKDLKNKIVLLLKKLQLFGTPASTVIPITEESWQRQNSIRSDIFSLTLALIAEFSFSGSCDSTASLIKSYITRFTINRNQFDQLIESAVKMYEAPLHNLKKDELQSIFEETFQPSDQPESQIQKESYFQFLLNMGFLVERQPGFFGFRFHNIFCYLLSRKFVFKSTNNWDHYLFNPIDNSALAFNDEKDYLQKWLTQKDLPLFRNVGLIGLHFEKVSSDQGIINNLLPKLVSSLQQEDLNLSIKLKFLSLILKLGNDTPLKVFDYLLSKSQSGKIFSILGYGFYNSTKSISFLKQLMISATPLEKAFCAISLLRIGSSEARTVLLESLNFGDDLYRRLVCEMISVDRIDGISLLTELSVSNNISIRKSSIFGMKLIDEPWVVDFLTNLIAKDSEWLVRDTASAAIDEISNHQIELNNQAPPTPDKIAWLVEIAGKHGQNIAVKTIPNELLMEIVNNGPIQEKMASLNILSRYSNKEVVDFIISLFENDTELEDQAFFYTSQISLHEVIN